MFKIPLLLLYLVILRPKRKRVEEKGDTSPVKVFTTIFKGSINTN